MCPPVVRLGHPSLKLFPFSFCLFSIWLTSWSRLTLLLPSSFLSFSHAASLSVPGLTPPSLLPPIPLARIAPAQSTPLPPPPPPPRVDLACARPTAPNHRIRAMPETPARWSSSSLYGKNRRARPVRGRPPGVRVAADAQPGAGAVVVLRRRGEAAWQPGRSSTPVLKTTSASTSPVTAAVVDEEVLSAGAAAQQQLADAGAMDFDEKALSADE